MGYCVLSNDPRVFNMFSITSHFYPIRFVQSSSLFIYGGKLNEGITSSHKNFNFEELPEL